MIVVGENREKAISPGKVTGPHVQLETVTVMPPITLRCRALGEYLCQEQRTREDHRAEESDLSAASLWDTIPGDGSKGERAAGRTRQTVRGSREWTWSQMAKAVQSLPRVKGGPKKLYPCQILAISVWDLIWRKSLCRCD